MKGLTSNGALIVGAYCRCLLGRILRVYVRVMLKMWVGTKPFWARQLRQWHWISSAVCLVLMLMFAVTGVTLNHADIFESAGTNTVQEVALPDNLHARLSRLAQGSAMPDAEVADIRRLTGADLAGRKIDNQYNEMVFDLAAPGRDQVLTIDLNTKMMIYEVTDRGTVALFNDLHKGRHSGSAWKFLIDVSAVFFIIFALTGFGLLALHARMRISTWPLTALGVVVPVVIFLLLVH